MLELYEPKKPYWKMNMKDLKKHIKLVKKLDNFFNGDYNKELDKKNYKKLFCRKTRKRRIKKKKTRRKKTKGLKKTKRNIKLVINEKEE
tara:strand:+ start:1181 stop:1447 length:267 start_codon:yes stop_codon:yes gene_type:complete